MIPTMFIRDLALRSRVQSALAGLELDRSVAVVHLLDDRAVEAFLQAGTFDRAVGFYPHVRIELADRATQLGIEPIEQRVFFDDIAAAVSGKA